MYKCNNIRKHIITYHLIQSLNVSTIYSIYQKGFKSLFAMYKRFIIIDNMIIMIIDNIFTHTIFKQSTITYSLYHPSFLPTLLDDYNYDFQYSSIIIFLPFHFFSPVFSYQFLVATGSPWSTVSGLLDNPKLSPQLTGPV